MPGSAISYGSASQASSGSRRARTRKYHSVSHTSQVDESLFGAPHRETKRAEMLEEKRRPDGIEEQARQRSANRNKARGNKKETIQVVTKDLIRNLVVPDEDPSGQSVILPFNEYYRIKMASRVLSQEEKIAMWEERKREKENAMEAVQDRKNFMKQKDLHRHKNEKLSELEEEEREKQAYLTQRANELRQEQEDEIKYLNELILNAKCHAIRDAQILEKRQISQEMSEEEKRLDAMMELILNAKCHAIRDAQILEKRQVKDEMAGEEMRLDQMMEVDRVNSIRMQEEIEQKRMEERRIGALQIMQQIQENEQNKLLELERKDQENKLAQKYIDKLCEEDIEKDRKKREQQRQLREDLNEANNNMLERRELEKQQDVLTDLKVAEYQKAKAEREAAYEAEQEKIRIEKEREIARLRTLQERAKDEQAERDALRAKRAQEAAERDWRKKEAEEARKKAETEEMLKHARAQQMDQKEHFLAVQAQRERAEFERVLRAQQELVEKEHREEHQKVQQRSNYATEVRQQIREKESQRVHERNNFFEEGVRLDEEARLRRAKLDEIKRKKIDELRNAGIHEKYLAQVERKINQPQHIAA